MVAAIMLLKVGYELGKVDAVDEELDKQVVIELETEDQILDYLYN